MNQKIIGIFLTLIFLVTGCSEVQVDDQGHSTGDTDGQIIGGDTDKYGCLVSAGYLWNETIFACARSWELDHNQAKAAQIVVAPLSVMPRTVVKVDTLNCEGCYIVHVQSGDSQRATKLIDWKIVFESKITDFEDCVRAGNPVMESYPRQCSADGKTFIEKISHVCTNEESLTTVCTREYNPVCAEIVLNMGDTFYQTFDNGCSACAAMKVVSYVQGICPSEK